MEMRLGNPNGDRTAPPAPCGVCPNCKKVKIFPRINKDGKLITFRIIDLKYDEDQSEIILGLARCHVKSTDLVMNSDTFWNEMQLLA